MKQNKDAYDFGYKVAVAHCRTPESMADLNRQLNQYGHVNATAMVALLTGEQPDLDFSDIGSVQAIMQGIAGRRYQSDAHRCRP